MEHVFVGFEILVKIKGLERDIFFFHKIRIILIQPLNPTIPIKGDEMLFGQNKIRNNPRVLVIKINLNIIRRHSILSISGINRQSSFITYIQIVNLIPDKKLNVRKTYCVPL